MVAVLVIGLVFEWAAREIRSARGRRDAVTVVKAARFVVLYDWQWKDGKTSGFNRPPPWPDWLVRFVGIDLLSQPVLLDLSIPMINNFGRSPPGPADKAFMALVARLGRLESLNLINNPRLVDADLIHLGGLTRLRELRLGRSGVKGPGLVHITKLPHLETLVLSRMIGLSDNSLAPLANLRSLRHLSIVGPANAIRLRWLDGLSNLENLNLNGNAFDDSCTVAVSRLAQLKELGLTYTNVTDTGILQLRNMTNLREIRLDHSRVTDAGVAKLQSSLPKAKIHWKTQNL